MYAPYFTTSFIKERGHEVNGPIAPVFQPFAAPPQAIDAIKTFLTTGAPPEMPLRPDMLQYAQVNQEVNSQQVYLTVPHTGFCLHYRITDLLT